MLIVHGNHRTHYIQDPDLENKILKLYDNGGSWIMKGNWKLKKMKIGIIPPVTRTGEYKYGEHLVRGLIERGLDVELLNNRFLVYKSNLKIFLGSLLLKKIIDKDIEILA